MIILQRDDFDRTGPPAPVGLARHGSRHAGEPKILSCSERMPHKKHSKRQYSIIFGRLQRIFAESGTDAVFGLDPSGEKRGSEKPAGFSEPQNKNKITAEIARAKAEAIKIVCYPLGCPVYTRATVSGPVFAETTPPSSNTSSGGLPKALRQAFSRSAVCGMLVWPII
jgi:hypothetical protein